MNNRQIFILSSILQLQYVQNLARVSPNDYVDFTRDDMEVSNYLEAIEQKAPSSYLFECSDAAWSKAIDEIIFKSRRVEISVLAQDVLTQAKKYGFIQVQNPYYSGKTFHRRPIYKNNMMYVRFQRSDCRITGSRIVGNLLTVFEV